MKTKINRKALFSLLCLCSTSIMAQDLLVRTTGDSLKCHITRVTDSAIWFNIDHEGIKSTLLTQDKIASYQKDFFTKTKKVEIDTSVAVQLQKGRLILGVSSVIFSRPTSYNMSFYVKKDFGYFMDQGYGFNISPRFGYFLKNNLVAGMDVTFVYFSSRQSGIGSYAGSLSDQTIIKSVSVDPFVRYYFRKKKVIPFFEIGSMLCRSNVKYTATVSELDSYEKTSNILIFKGSSGLSIPLGEKMSVDAMIECQVNEGNVFAGIRLGFVSFL